MPMTWLRFALLALALVAAAPAARAITITEVTSAGGITAWLVEDHSLPVVTIDFDFRGGAALDPAAKPGLANLACELLDEGAGDLDSSAFQGKLEDLATSFSASAGSDDIHVAMRTVTANLAPSVALLKLALASPRFDAAAITRVKRQVLASIARDERQPDAIADHQLEQATFGDHPYARRVHGTPAAIAAITADDLHGFVRARFAKDALIVAVVGDIAPEALKALLDATFGDLPDHAAPGAVPALAVSAKGALLLARLAIPQSVVSSARPVSSATIPIGTRPMSSTTSSAAAWNRA